MEKFVMENLACVISDNEVRKTLRILDNPDDEDHQTVMAMIREAAGRANPKSVQGQDVSAMSPGSLPVWPISEQAALFGLIGHVDEDIGVRLSDSLLMVPAKSISGFFFSMKTHYENCRLCPMPNCPNRRVKYLPGQVTAAGLSTAVGA